VTDHRHTGAAGRRRHQAKVAALTAYRDGALRPNARARLEQHLDGCPVCRRTLVAMDAYERAREEAARAPLHTFAPGLDDRPGSAAEDAAWTRLRAALPPHRASPRAARGARGLWGAAFAGAAAAAVALGLMVGTSDGNRAARSETRPTDEPHAAIPSPAPEPAAPAALSAWVVAGSLDARVGGRALAELDPATTPRVANGTILDVPRGAGFLDLAIGDDGDGIDGWEAGFRVTAGSRAVIDRLAADDIVVRVLRGTVSSQVTPRPAARGYAVVAGPWRLRVLGTVFAVTRRAGGAVDAAVSEGRVAIGRPNGAERVLRAPGRWSSDDATGDEPADGDASTPLPRPWLGLASPDDLTAAAPAPFTLAPAEGLAGWAFGELDAPAVAMRLWSRPERLRDGALAALSRDGRRLALTVSDGGGPIPTPDGLRPRAPVRRMGTLPPEQIRAVVHRGRRQLRRCYDRALRTTGGDFSADVTLRLRIARTGAVARADAQPAPGDESPPAFVACVAARAGDWHFPQPDGGPVDVAVPIHFDAAEN